MDLTLLRVALFVVQYLLFLTTVYSVSLQYCIEFYKQSCTKVIFIGVGVFLGGGAGEHWIIWPFIEAKFSCNLFYCFIVFSNK